MTLVKICGIKTLAEACEVASLDVDFLGVIFAKTTSGRTDGARDIKHRARGG